MHEIALGEKLLEKSFWLPVKKFEFACGPVNATSDGEFAVGGKGSTFRILLDVAWYQAYLQPVAGRTIQCGLKAVQFGKRNTKCSPEFLNQKASHNDFVWVKGAIFLLSL